MSLSDVTIDSRVYALNTIVGQRALRKMSKASLPIAVDGAFLEIAHTDGSGNKPDRHMVKVSWTSSATETRPALTASVHFVLTMPKGFTADEKTGLLANTTGSNTMVADLIAFIVDEGVVERIENGEYD